MPPRAAHLRSARPSLYLFQPRGGPDLLGENDELRFGEGYRFEIGRDDLLHEGSDGYILSYGESLYRCLNVVDQLRAEGVSVGLVNKSTLNVPDEASLARLGRAPFVLVVETQNQRTGLGIRVGTWLLDRGYSPRYAHLGTHRAGCGGLAEQVPHQGLDEAGILTAVRRLHAPREGSGNADGDPFRPGSAAEAGGSEMRNAQDGHVQLATLGGSTLLPQEDRLETAEVELAIDDGDL